jgi:ATP-binding cassette, subfamily F, member 3
VANGTLRPFDGDLDDYRDFLLKKEEKPARPAPAPKPKKEKEKKEKGQKIDKAAAARIQRLEKEMAKLNERKAAIESRLADPAVYQDAPALKALLLDQAYVAKELEQVEAEWLALAK